MLTCRLTTTATKSAGEMVGAHGPWPATHTAICAFGWITWQSDLNMQSPACLCMQRRHFPTTACHLWQPEAQKPCMHATCGMLSLLLQFAMQAATGQQVCSRIWNHLAYLLTHGIRTACAGCPKINRLAIDRFRFGLQWCLAKAVEMVSYQGHHNNHC